MFGSVGAPELVLIFILALLIFGPQKLPELGRALGRGLNQFRKATTELKETLEKEMTDAEASPTSSGALPESPHPHPTEARIAGEREGGRDSA